MLKVEVQRVELLANINDDRAIDEYLAVVACEDFPYEHFIGEVLALKVTKEVFKLLIVAPEERKAETILEIRPKLLVEIVIAL